ncbi:MAG TPA: hypothetical protein VFV05_19940 [Methylomirabilota bacterium]|nr:hypothetical protein [Methylomirabilota bacterium]
MAATTARQALLWPSANEYMAALQNPTIAFSDPQLRDGTAVRDRLGMPLVASGNFAYVFKVRVPKSGERAVKCFRQFLGDRERRYVAIDSYLDAHQLRAIADFEYAPRGIRIGGATYPILVMEWIQGPTLDVYVGAALRDASSRKALRVVAEEWCRVVKELEDRGTAHGDLQHGNVIVGTGGLRLVDLDGMYVPSLAGLSAAESGHAHFQHPRRRAAARGDVVVDRFPGLVIYLSLVALAENPSLWDRYHDDNLIFVRRDFEEPDRSPLFGELLRAGGEVGALAATLKRACTIPPADTPRLAELVQVRGTRLPAWIRGDEIVVVTTKSRETAASPPPLAPTTPMTAPAYSRIPAVSASPITAASTPLPPQHGFANRPLVRSPDWVLEGLGRGLGLAWLGFLTWVWLPVPPLLTALGISQADRTIIVLYLGICFGLGLLTSSKTRP